jgi:hypothetical protein
MKPAGKKQTHRWKDIKMDLGKMGYRGTNWIYLAQHRDSCWAPMKVIMNLYFK